MGWNPDARRPDVLPRRTPPPKGGDGEARRWGVPDVTMAIMTLRAQKVHRLRGTRPGWRACGLFRRSSAVCHLDVQLKSRHRVT